jgi:hypothetical protein
LRDDQLEVRNAVIASVMLVIATASAEPLPDRSKRLFNEGLTLKDQGDPRACDRFAESYSLVAAPGAGFNLAECMEQQGQLLRAWQLYNAAIDEWNRTAQERRAAVAKERARAIEMKLVTLVVEIDEPTLDKLSVTIGKRVIEPKRKIRELADPGDIEIRAVAPGRVPFVQTVHADAGATRKVRIALDAIGTNAAGEPLVETHRRRSRVALAGALALVGTGGLVAGTVLFLDARKLQSNGETDRAQRKADLATGLGVGGALCVIAGAVVFATAPRDVTVMPVATQTSAGLSIVGSF